MKQTKMNYCGRKNNNDWYTPSNVIESARKVLGKIDLDPASSDKANEVVKASKYYTIEDDGLCHGWYGKVFMNPPYNHGIVGKFILKLLEHFKAKEVTEAIVLVNNCTDTKWMQKAFLYCSAVCFYEGRITFIYPDGSDGANSSIQGQCILYFGNNSNDFFWEFRRYGAILLPPS